MMALGAALPPNRGALLGLADLRANDPTRGAALVELHHALGSAGEDLPGPLTRPWAGLVGAWGVRRLIAAGAGVTGPAAAGWEEAARGPGGVLYRNPRALPVARLASRTELPTGAPGDGGWEAVDFALSAVSATPLPLGGSGRLEVLTARPSRHELRVVCDGDVLVVLHVPGGPGWRAEVDGRPTPLLAANLAAMAVPLGAGEHLVTFAYRPRGLIIGAAMTALGLIVAAVWGWPRGKRR